MTRRVFLPTATMANQIALRLLTEPGDEVIAEIDAHIFRYELGGPAVHSGLAMKSLETEDGRFTPAQVAEVVNPPADLHMAPTKVVCIENTHNGGGGRVWPLEQVRAVAAEARAQGLFVHLDGARLLNAAVASGTPAARLRARGRHGDALPLERPRLPARRARRGLARADGEGAATQAPLRRGDAAGRHRGRCRACMRSTTMSSGSRTTTRTPGDWPRAWSMPACRSASSRWRRTSSSSTSARSASAQTTRSAAAPR